MILGLGLFQTDGYCCDQHDCDRLHLAEDGFEAASFAIDRPLEAEKFQHFLEGLSPEVFRAKGVLWIEGSDRRYLFHLVGQRFTLDETPPARPTGNRLVLIGRNLDRGRLQRQLEACAAT